MKKILAAILALCMLFAFAGCSTGEVGMYRTVKQIQSLKDYSYAGDLSADIQNLSVSATDNAAAETEALNELKAMLKDQSLLFSGSVNSTNDKFTLNLSTKSGGTTQNLLNLITEPGTIYVNKDIADKYFPTQCHSTSVTISGVTYAKYDATDLLTALENAEYAYTAPDNPYSPDTQEVQFNGYDEGSNYGYMDGYDGNAKDDQCTDDSVSADFTAAYKEGYDAAYPAGKADAATDASNRALALQGYAPILEGLLNINSTSGQDLQNRINALFEDMIGTFTDSPDLGIASKTGDNSFKANMTVDTVTSAIKKAIQYLSTHTTQLKAVLTRFVDSLSTDEFNEVFPGEKKSDVLAAIDAISSDTFTQSIATTDDSGSNESITPIQAVDEIASALAQEFDTSHTGVQFALTKTGVSSYETTETASFVTAANNDLGLNANISATLHFNINSGSAVLPTSIKSASVKTGAATLQLGITDPNASETGVLVSTSRSMNGAKRIKAAKSGSSYTVSLSGLSAGTTYYYQVYSVDNAGNLLKDSTVRTFTTAKASAAAAAGSASSSGTVPNPKTGSATPAPAVALMLLSAAGSLAFGLRMHKGK